MAKRRPFGDGMVRKRDEEGRVVASYAECEEKLAALIVEMKEETAALRGQEKTE